VCRFAHEFFSKFYANFVLWNVHEIYMKNSTFYLLWNSTYKTLQNGRNNKSTSIFHHDYLDLQLHNILKNFVTLHPLLTYKQLQVKMYNKEPKRALDVKHNQSKSNIYLFITIWNHSNHWKLVLSPSHKCQGT